MSYVNVSIEKMKHYISRINTYHSAYEETCEKVNRDLSHWRTRAADVIDELILLNVQSFFEDRDISVVVIPYKDRDDHRLSSLVIKPTNANTHEGINYDVTIALHSTFIREVINNVFDSTNINESAFVPSHLHKCQITFQRMVDYSDGHFVTVNEEDLNILDNALEKRNWAKVERRFNSFLYYYKADNHHQISINWEYTPKTRSFFAVCGETPEKRSWSGHCSTSLGPFPRDGDFEVLHHLKREYSIHSLLATVTAAVTADLNEILGTEGFICTFAKDEIEKTHNRIEREVTNV